MNYLIIGATGYIGQAFVKYCMLNDVCHYALSRSEIDYTEQSPRFLDWLDSYINKYSEITIINCAGYIGKPNVDACESARMDTLYGNVSFAQHISFIAQTLQVPFAHISSGCIYSGSKQFTETDKPNFELDTGGSFYSGTKAMAERIISNNPTSWQFRLRIPFDEIPSPRNYLTKLITYDKIIDVENSVSHRGDFVKACMQLMKTAAPYGIYNVVNPGSITTKQVAEKLAKAGLKNKFKYFNNYKSFDSAVKAGRSNCTLSTDKLLNYVDMRTSIEALDEAIHNYRI